MPVPKILLPHARQRGFTLVELLVGVVVGLLAVLVITQVTTLSEGRKRTLSMGSDAQINGALALFTLQRDIEQAGYGVGAAPQALGCPTKYAGSAHSDTFTLAPVVIVDGGAAKASDQVTILQANTTSFSAPMGLTENTTNPPTSAGPFKVVSTLGAIPGSLMVLVPMKLSGTVATQAWTTDGTVSCSLFAVTSDALTTTQLSHSSAGSSWNQDSVFPAIAVEGNPTYLDSLVLNLGKTMLLRTYAISNSATDTGNLQSTDLSSTDGSSATTDLYPQIVMLKAMYGKSTAAPTSAAPNPPVAGYDKTTPTTNAQWQMVRSIRVALVARSAQYEKDIVTPNTPAWNVGTAVPVATGVAGCASGSCQLDVSGIVGTNQCPTGITGSCWQHFRYKVYDTIVPLRNMLWHS